MARSADTTAAVLLGTPNVTLYPYETSPGSFRLDAGRAPHVSGTLTINPPLLATLAALDPRQSPAPRVRVTLTRVSSSGTQTRVFNLSVRDRRVDQENARVVLTLESDESLLGDFRALADDTDPLNYQSSLRALVNYVLGEAIPGTTLNTSLSAPDVAIPALSDSTNLIRNPRVAVNTTDWFATYGSGSLTTGQFATGGPTDSPTRWYMLANSNTTGAYTYITDSAVAISAGKKYMLSLYTRSATGVNLIMDAWMLDGPGSVVASSAAVAISSVAGTWFRTAVVFTATETATKLRPRVSVVGTLATGVAVEVTGVRLSEYSGDPADTGYYDGDTTDTAQYIYSWPTNGVAHASPAVRKVAVDAATPAALTWRAGQTALDFMHPLVQRFGLRLVCDEARVWTLRDDTFLAPGSLAVRYGINMTAGEDSISRDSGIWYDARVTKYIDTTPAGARIERIDAFTLNTPPTRVDYLEVQAAYPGPGRSQHAVSMAQQRGREVVGSAMADLTAAAEQSIAILLNGAPSQTGITQSVVFDLGSGDMTVNTRTVETGVGAIDLLTGTINGLTGTINGL